MDEKKSPARKASRRKLWQSHLQAWASSGLSRAEYCRRRDLSYHAFKYWEKKLLREKNPLPAFVSVPAVRLEQAALVRKGSAKLRVTLGDRYRIEVDDDFSSATLSRLISVLEDR